MSNVISLLEYRKRKEEEKKIESSLQEFIDESIQDVTQPSLDSILESGRKYKEKQEKILNFIKGMKNV